MLQVGHDLQVTLAVDLAAGVRLPRHSARVAFLAAFAAPRPLAPRPACVTTQTRATRSGRPTTVIMIAIQIHPQPPGPSSQPLTSRSSHEPLGCSVGRQRLQKCREIRKVAIRERPARHVSTKFRAARVPPLHHRVTEGLEGVSVVTTGLAALLGR